MARHWWVAVAVLAAGEAWPCSGSSCEQFFGVVPRPGSTIPANARALAIQQTLFSEASWDGGTALATQGAQTFSVTRLDGGAISAPVVEVNTELWAVLDGGLTAGDTLNVSATLGTQCTSAGLLTVGPAAPLPTAVATISLASRVVLDGTGGACGGPQGSVQHALLTIAPSAELAPWAAMTRWELELDGQNYATSGYGAVGATPQTGTPATAGLHPVNTFHVQCAAPADAGAQLDAKLSLGVHQVRLLARVTGLYDPIASNTLTVDMDCVPSAVPDAGTPPAADAGTSSPDAGVAAANDDLGKRAQTGCTAAPGLVWAALALVLIRRR